MSMPVINPALPPPPESIRTSEKATCSLILGIMSLICLFLTGLPAILSGLFALREIGRSRGRLTGRRRAIAGIAVGVLGCLLGLLAVVQVYYAWDQVNQQMLSQNNLRQIGMAYTTTMTPNSLFLWPAPAIPNLAST